MSGTYAESLTLRISFIRIADSGARCCVPLALHTLFLNTLHQLIFLLVVNPTLLSLHCAIVDK